jgi:hypothetical protein
VAVERSLHNPFGHIYRRDNQNAPNRFSGEMRDELRRERRMRAKALRLYQDLG